MKKSSIFWVGYSDLMTSLFFVMLVLYIVTFVILNSKSQELTAQAEQLEKIKNVEKALSDLDPRYFEFDDVNKRYRMSIDASFRGDSPDILDIPIETRKEILKAGQNLYAKMEAIISENPDINYLLVIEGLTQRATNSLGKHNWVDIPNAGYKLSYKRSLALYNYWKSNGLDFRAIGEQCEVIIAGSGYFSQARDVDNEDNNRKFSIQITSKVGKFLNQEKVPE
jgi:hypothetical protein